MTTAAACGVLFFLCVSLCVLSCHAAPVLHHVTVQDGRSMLNHQLQVSWQVSVPSGGDHGPLLFEVQHCVVLPGEQEGEEAQCQQEDTVDTTITLRPLVHPVCPHAPYRITVRAVGAGGQVLDSVERLHQTALGKWLQHSPAAPTTWWSLGTLAAISAALGVLLCAALLLHHCLSPQWVQHRYSCSKQGLSSLV